jgi:hypothetical protein
MELSEILTKYGVPDPKIVGKLPKGGIQLDFVGHADTQKALTEIDPTWSMEPVAFDSDGLPAYRVENGMAHMACWMTLLGVRRLGIGSVMHNKPDLLKELLSDAIRNCAMRHNVYLSLWTKSEWDDVDNHKPAPANKPVPKTAPKPAPTADGFISNEQRQQLQAACAKAGIAPEVMAQNAGLDWNGDIKDSDIPALRAAFKELKEFKEGA